MTRHPWLVLAVWLVLVLAALPLARLAPKALSPNPGGLEHAESTRVTRILEDRFGERDQSPLLLVTRSDLAADDPRFVRAYDRFVRDLRDIEHVSGVLRYDASNVYETVSEDGRTTLSIVQIPLDDDATLAAVRALAREQSGALRVQVTGGQAIAKDFTKFSEEDTKRSELMALPLTAAVLLVVFGALVATGLPLLVGVLSITVALGGLYGITQMMEVSTFALSVITMLGLGAGIDYALLMVSRFREELAKLRGTADERTVAREAARRTVLTAGRSVAFSGLTVAVAMAGLLVPPLAFMRSMGMGGVLVVLLTILASVTALPAILALLGERVNSPRRFRFSWGENPRSVTVWENFARKVIRRPWLAVLAGSGVLLALAWPAQHMQMGYAGAWGLSPGVESRDALQAVDELGAGGILTSFEVLLDLRGAPYDAQARAQFRSTVEALEGVEGVRAVISPFVRPEDLARFEGGGLEQLMAVNRRSLSDDRRYLRVTVLPEKNLRPQEIDVFTDRLRSILAQGDLPFLLGGAAVGQREWTRAIVEATPLAVGAVFAATFVLLAVAFRSLLIPLKSIVMNTLTVGAAYGVVTLVVQMGFLAGPLGIPADVGVLDSSLPLILFAVLFGLSMDYEIFLLSRVHEEHLRGYDNDEAVVRAVGRTGRIITSAALIMFIVFCAFISGRVVANKSIGLGLAVAVALDATLVRMVLVPGFLKLAGRWNWWLPRWLSRRIPRVSLEH